MASVLGDMQRFAGLVDFEEAMGAVAAEMNEPWEWNKWQKAASEMLAIFPEGSRVQAEWTTLRQRQMLERFGPGWKERAKRARTALAPVPGDAQPAGGGAQVLAPAAKRRAAPAAPPAPVAPGLVQQAEAPQPGPMGPAPGL